MLVGVFRNRIKALYITIIRIVRVWNDIDSYIYFGGLMSKPQLSNGFKYNYYKAYYTQTKENIEYETKYYHTANVNNKNEFTSI